MGRLRRCRWCGSDGRCKGWAPHPYHWGEMGSVGTVIQDPQVEECGDLHRGDGSGPTHGSQTPVGPSWRKGQVTRGVARYWARDGAVGQRCRRLDLPRGSVPPSRQRPGVRCIIVGGVSPVTVLHRDTPHPGGPVTLRPPLTTSGHRVSGDRGRDPLFHRTVPGSTQSLRGRRPLSRNRLYVPPDTTRLAVPVREVRPRWEGPDPRTPRDDPNDGPLNVVLDPDWPSHTRAHAHTPHAHARVH